LFRATLQDIGVIKDSLDSIAALITEGTFRINEDGMRLTAMDPASVAMVDFRILPSAFLDFSAPEEEVITLNITNFVEVLKRARANDQISLELADNKLKITMKGDFKRNFSLPIIDTLPGSQKVPDLEFKGRVVLATSALKEGIKDASMVSDCVIFEADPTTFVVNSMGDTSETRMELKKDAVSLEELEISTQIKSKYSIDYLEKMLKGAKFADSVKLQFSSDYPLRMDLVAVDKIQLSFVLAPRVDTD
jgi:proliferating cell nuclear antigen